MADTRMAALLAELEAHGWLAGEWHQRHHDGHVALEFACADGARIVVHPVPDIAARSIVRFVETPHPAAPGNAVLVKRVEEIPAVSGTGYALGCGKRGERAATAADAVAVMAQWREDKSASGAAPSLS